MTDYKNLKLIATSSPHIRGNETTRSIMLDVIIAMLPAVIFGIYNFGMRALTLTLVSVIGCVFFEWLYRAIMTKPQSVGDLSAAVTGMLLGLVMYLLDKAKLTNEYEDTEDDGSSFIDEIKTRT